MLEIIKFCVLLKILCITSNSSEQSMDPSEQSTDPQTGSEQSIDPSEQSIDPSQLALFKKVFDIKIIIIPGNRSWSNEYSDIILN